MPPALDLLRAVMAVCYLGMTVITEPECSSSETDRALSWGMVSMAIASASECLPVTTSWWFNEFITKFQRKTESAWDTYCAAPKCQNVQWPATCISAASAWTPAQGLVTGSLGAPGSGSRGGNPPESAATWSVKASVPVILGMWKNHMSLHDKLALVGPDGIHNNSCRAQMHTPK